MSYAEQTSVPIERSKAEIERMLLRYGADRFMAGTDTFQAFVAFQCRGKMIKFVLPLPDRKDKKFFFTPARGKRRTDQEAYEGWEQACRSRYRALCLAIKAKLEAVQSGITSFEAEFLAHFVLPDGGTFGQYAIPRLEEAAKLGQMPQLQIGWNGDK